MLLTCPHCSDIAEIPSIFRKFYGMPIACHACTGVFYVPRHIAETAQHSVREHHQNIRCSSCRISLMVPTLKNAADKKFSMLCPACKSNISTSRIRRRGAYLIRSENLVPVIVGGCIGAMIVYMNQQGLFGDSLNIIELKIQALFVAMVEFCRSIINHIEQIYIW